MHVSTTQKHPGAEIELFERDLILEIRGSKTTRRRAKKYCKGVMDQRTGPVNVTQASSHNWKYTLHAPSTISTMLPYAPFNQT